MERPAPESAKDNLLTDPECNNVHSAQKPDVEHAAVSAVPSYGGNSTGVHSQAESDASEDEDSSSDSEGEHHEFPPDSLVMVIISIVTKLPEYHLFHRLRGKLFPIMKSNPVQYTIITLVIADCLIIVVELLIDMEIVVFPEDEPYNSTHQQNSSHLIAYTNSDLNHSESQSAHDLNSWLLNTAHHWLTGNSTNQTDGTDHDDHHHTNKEKAQHVLHMLSLAILSVFMVEVCLKIFVERSHLLKQKAEVFDAIVVIISFTLDVTFTFVSVSSVASDAAGLMVLLRLWRVTSIINGVVMSVKHDAKMKMAVQKKICRKLEHENRKLKSRIEKLERDNANLKKKLRESQTLSSGTGPPPTDQGMGEGQPIGCCNEHEAIEMQELRETV